MTILRMITKVIAIFIITLVVRIISITTGGGSLILVPILTLFGLSPNSAIATHRIGSFSTNVSLLKFHKHKYVKWKIGLFTIIPTILGAYIGGSFLSKVDSDVFSKIFGVLLIGSVPFFYRKDSIFKEVNVAININSGWKIIMLIFIAFVASMVGAAFSLSVIWYTMMYLSAGLAYKQAAANRNLNYMATTFGSFYPILRGGLLNWPIVFTIFAASLIGAWIGADLCMKMNQTWLKFLVLTMIGIGGIMLILR